MLISIAMTCFNLSKYISDAILSLNNQDYENWQLVIVDDCSTDNSLSVINDCIIKLNISHKKVKILSTDINRGYGYSLRKAIKNCDGDLVGILDGDDILDDKSALRISVKTHGKNPTCSLTYSNINIYNKNLKKKGERRSIKVPSNMSIIDGKFKVSHFKVFKKKLYNLTEGVNKSLKRSVDKDLILKLEEVGPLIFIDLFLYGYRYHESNITRLIKGKEIDKMRIKIYEDARQRRSKEVSEKSKADNR